MGILRTLIGAALCIGLGIFLGSHSFSGHTAVEHAERAIQGRTFKAPRFDEVKENVEDAIDSAKRKLSAKQDEPTEKHSSEDRDAVNRLIAHRKP